VCRAYAPLRLSEGVATLIQTTSNKLSGRISHADVH
jgi:hypothetical protein